MPTTTLHLLDNGTFAVDGGAMFGVVPKALWAKLVPADADNLTRWAMRSLLVASADRLILVDAGIGDKHGARFLQRYRIAARPLPEALRACGFAPADVTDLVFTHLHFDHCGGATVRRDGVLRPAFPAATCWVTRRQWDAATRPNARERGSYLGVDFLPLAEAGRLRFWEPGARLGHDFDCIESDGHTDGQLIPRVRCGGRTCVFAADLIPSVHHVALPYLMAYDLRPLVLLQEKEALLRAAAAEGQILLFQHDPVHEACTVAATEKGIRPDRVEQTFRLALAERPGSNA